MRGMSFMRDDVTVGGCCGDFPLPQNNKKKKIYFYRYIPTKQRSVLSFILHGLTIPVWRVYFRASRNGNTSKVATTTTTSTNKNYCPSSFNSRYRVCVRELFFLNYPKPCCSITHHNKQQRRECNISRCLSLSVCAVLSFGPFALKAKQQPLAALLNASVSSFLVAHAW